MSSDAMVDVLSELLSVQKASFEKQKQDADRHNLFHAEFIQLKKDLQTQADASARQAELSAAHLEEQLSLQRDRLIIEMRQLANTDNDKHFFPLRLMNAAVGSDASSSSYSDNDSELTPEELLVIEAHNNKWRAIADALIEFRSNNGNSNATHVRRIFKENAKFLSPLTAVFPNIRFLITSVLTNSGTIRQKRPSGKAKVAISSVQNLQNLTQEEALVLGRKFRRHLLNNKEMETAVEAYRLANPLLQPIFDKCPFFGAMLSKIAGKLLTSSSMGLAKRVGLGAALSITDLFSDIMVVLDYYKTGKTKAANALLAMIGINIFFQLVLVYSQNRKRTRLTILKEAVIALSGLKPAFDAHRVATGFEDDETVISPLAEMVMGKGGELSFESIPGSLLQGEFCEDPCRLFLSSPN